MINHTHYLAVMRSGRLGLGCLALGVALCLVGSTAMAAEFPGMGVDKFETRAAFKIVCAPAFKNIVCGGHDETPPFMLGERNEVLNCVGTCDLGGTNTCMDGTRHGLSCTTSDANPVTGCPPKQVNSIDINGDGMPDRFDFNGDGACDDINDFSAFLEGTCDLGGTNLCTGGVRHGQACTTNDEFDLVNGCPDLQPGKTFIGRSDPKAQVAPGSLIETTVDTRGTDINFDVETMAQPLCRYPSGFPAPSSLTPNRREVDTEILHLELERPPDAAMPHQILLRAGNPFKTRAPDLYMDSFGEVASFNANGTIANDFPAASVFNVFAMIEINSPQLILFNLQPMVLFLFPLQTFPPFLGFPTGTYIHDPNFPPVPLFNQFGLLVGWLASAGHGSPFCGQLFPIVIIQVPLINVIINFLVLGTTGLPGGPNPNDVRADAAAMAPELPLTVYQSKGDQKNTELFMGNGFRDGDAMNSLSFGRDGTVHPTTHIKTPGVLFFSASANSMGEACTDLFFDQQQPRFARGGATVYGAAMPPEGFGLHANNVVPFPSKQVQHFHVRSSDTSGLSFGTGTCDVGGTNTCSGGPRHGLACTQDDEDPGTGCPDQDDMTGLEIGARRPGDNLYGTFKGLSFEAEVGTCDVGGTNTCSGGLRDGLACTQDNEDPGTGCPDQQDNTASIFVTPATNPFNKSNLKRYARAEHLGLAPGDLIDALVLSDVTSPTKLYCDRLVSSTAQSADSVVAGNRPDDVLAAPDGFTGEFNNDGVNPGEVVCSFTGRPIINGLGNDLKIHTLADEGYEVLASNDVDCGSLTFTSLGIAPAGSTVWEFNLNGLAEARCVKIRNTVVAPLVDNEGPRIDAVEALNFAPSPRVDMANGNRDPAMDEVLFSLAPGSPSLGTMPRNTTVCPDPPAGQLSPGDVLYAQFDGSFCVFARAEDLGLRPEDDIDALDVMPDPGPLTPNQVHLVSPQATDRPNRNEVKVCVDPTDPTRCEHALVHLAVQARSTGVPERDVVVTVRSGDLTLSDITGAEGTQLTVQTNNSGGVQVALRANDVGNGWGVVETTVPGTTLKAFTVIKISAP